MPRQQKTFWDVDVKSYNVPCSWEMYGYVKVKAKNLGEAIQIAEGSECSLPSGDYVVDRFRVDYDVIEDYNQ